MTITEAQAVNAVLSWAMGKPTPVPITDEAATQAGQLLAAKAYKALAAGLRPEQVTLTSYYTEPACRVCGCTDDKPCTDGCAWIQDPKDLGELCSLCVILLERAHLL